MEFGKSSDEEKKVFYNICHQIVIPSHLFDDAQHLHPSSSRGLRGERPLHLLSVVVQGDGRDVKLGLVVDLDDAAGVRTTLVHLAQRPVVANDLVADGVDVILVVEVVKLVRQNLSDRVEEQRADSQDLGVDAVSHHFGDLPVFVAVDVDPAVNGQGCQFLILFALGDMLELI